MQIVFDAQPSDAKSLKGVATDRLRFALRRLAPQVSTARVRLTDVNGPRGGVDKRAQIELKLLSRGSLVVAATAANWHAALEDAMRRSATRIVKTFKQAQRPRRQSVKSQVLTQNDG